MRHEALDDRFDDAKPFNIEAHNAKGERVTRLKARSIMLTLGLRRAAKYLANRDIAPETAVYWLLIFREST